MTNKFQKIDIIIGIPSYNEEKNISFVTKQIDQGLSRYFPEKKCLIINLDNNSPDKTKENFLQTPTKNPKLYLPVKTRGKGRNLRKLFEFAVNSKAKAVATIDADLKSITPEWIKCLISPILTKKVDFIIPLYKRHPIDATITNHICYPMIYGLLGLDIRQPIGGEFAFNTKIIQYWLKQVWDNNTKGYGIDIFMTLNAIFGKFKIGQVNLNYKIHRSSGPKLNKMFDEVIINLFKILAKNKDYWQKEIKQVKKISLLCRTKSQKRIIPKPKGLEIIKSAEKLPLDYQLWTEIVYAIFKEYTKSKSTELIEALKPLYLSRVAYFIKEIKGKTPEEAEKLIKKQAQFFFRERYLVL